MHRSITRKENWNIFFLPLSLKIHYKQKDPVHSIMYVVLVYILFCKKIVPEKKIGSF